MQFTALLTIASAFAFVAAVPTPAEPATSPAANSPEAMGLVEIQKVCPEDFTSTGSCNGTSCRWGLTNYPCQEGSCVGEGGGDGSCCGWRGASGAYCPNGGW